MATEKLADQEGAVQTLDAGDFAALLNKEFKPKSDRAKEEVESAVRTLAEQVLNKADIVSDDVAQTINAYIAEYGKANRFNHEPRRHRKLLLHRRQIDKLLAAIQREGKTIVPTRLYFNDKGLVKLELALAKGKKVHDKREVSAERDWKRQQGRLMRDKG